MKGVILGIAPRCAVVDLTHDVAPQNIAEAAYRLAASCPFFPAATVFCCVVDPGVGSERRAVAVRTDRFFFVAPDNGLLAPALRRDPAVECVLLDNPALHLPAISSTFHGRDIFAPVAAHLASGVPFRELGTAIDTTALVQPADIDPVQTAAGWKGKVMAVDHFGNLLTNFAATHVEGFVYVEVGGVRVSRLSRTFADVPAFAPVAYIGSGGCLEIAVNRGNAAREWNLQAGADVLLVAQ